MVGLKMVVIQLLESQPHMVVVLMLQYLLIQLVSHSQMPFKILTKEMDITLLELVVHPIALLLVMVVTEWLHWHYMTQEIYLNML